MGALLQDRFKQGRECTKKDDQIRTTDSISRIPRETTDTKAIPSIAYRRSGGDMIEVYKLLTGKYSTNEGLLKINRHSSTMGHHLKLEKQRFSILSP